MSKACAAAGLSARTLQRWQACGGLASGDRRPMAVRPPPSHALTAEERAAVLAAANEPHFADMQPARIVPMLADDGIYLASESTFSRILRALGQVRHRGRAKAPRQQRPPTTYIATAPGQVWCWDMTYVPAAVAGRWFYLYLILDLYSRKIIGWEVHAEDDADHASHLVRRTAGATLKATTVLAMLHWLGIKRSYSRLRVSDDNAFAEALFRTARYRPEFPSGGFDDLDVTRNWAARFVHWYNVEHRPSGIRYVSPAQRHAGQDNVILEARHQVYLAAQARHPSRWSGQTRNWTPCGAVNLHPERDHVVSNVAKEMHTQHIAA